MWFDHVAVAKKYIGQINTSARRGHPHPTRSSNASVGAVTSMSAMAPCLGTDGLASTSPDLTLLASTVSGADGFQERQICRGITVGARKTRLLWHARCLGLGTIQPIHPCVERVVSLATIAAPGNC